MGQSESPERNGTRRKTLIVSFIGLLLFCLVGISLLVNHQATLRNYLPWRVQRITHLLNNSNSTITDFRGCICA